MELNLKLYRLDFCNITKYVFAPKPLQRMVTVGDNDSRDVGGGKGTQV